ncbi:O-antigen ligase family protein [Aeromonas sobria]|uniref:O-antigen ligase family protein n=1 Tax=Aeromonas sobria TaxID=646 RepID=UPI003F2B00F4
MTKFLRHYLESENCSSLMFLSVVLYVFFKDSVQLIGDIFQTIMIIGGLLAIYLYKDFFLRNIVFLLLVIGALVQTASWFMSTITIPELAQTYPNVKPFSYLLVFLVIAFWLKGSVKRSLLVLLSFSLGSIFTLFYHSDFIAQLISGWHGIRVDFGYRNAQHGSLIIGAAFIFIFWCIYAAKPEKISNRYYLMIATTSILLVCLGCLLLMLQSRQSWVAVMVSLLISPLLYSYLNNNVSFRKTTAVYISIIIVFFAIYHVSFVMGRVSTGFSHPDDLHNMISGHWREVKDLSIGIRLQTWLEAINWFFANPWFGTGDGSRSLVITESHVLPDYIKADIRHLHNSNFETAVSYGVVGLVYVYFLMIYPVYKTMKSHAPALIKAIAVSFLVYWLIINNFESFLYMRSGQWVFNTFFGAIYTFSLYSDFVEYQHGKKNI